MSNAAKHYATVSLTTAVLGLGAMCLLGGAAAVMAAAVAGLVAVGAAPARQKSKASHRRMPLVIVGPGQGARRALMPDGRVLRS